LEQIVETIERIKKEWYHIYHEYDKKTISFNKLETLKAYSIPLEYENELSILKQTHSGYSKKSNSKDNKTWISERATLLTTFRKLYLYRYHIPSLISLAQYLGNELKEDLDYRKLIETHNVLSKDWNGQILSNSVKYIDSVIFFEEFSNDQLDLLKEIEESKLIISWLKKYSSDQEFLNLCGICKSYTDDVRVLEALSSLISIRKMLNKILYSQYLFSSLKSLSDEIKCIDVHKYNGISNFVNLKNNFPLLLRVLFIFLNFRFLKRKQEAMESRISTS
jgi:hypothetical protein